jgi:hypothetical protein
MVIRRGALAALCLVGVGTLIAPAGASGTFVKTTGGVAGAVSSATLAAPTSLTAVRGACVLLTSAAVNLSWTATTSTFADGYEIFRSTTSGSGYVSLATVSGRTTTTFIDTTVAFSTTYFYVVEAKTLAWRSPNSNEASVTTPTLACV